MAVSKRLRYEILRRDNHTCRYCGATAAEAKLTIDHVTPEALGGTDTPDNLVAACADCNSGKTSSTPDATLVAGVSDDALRWADAMKQAADSLVAQEQPKHDYRAAFETTWSEWTWEHGGTKKTFELPAGWKTSIENFRQAGLPVTVWPDIVEKAMTNRAVRHDNLFRYCCGIAWRMVHELHVAARAIVSPRSTPEGPKLDALGHAAVDAWARAWTSDYGQEPPAEARQKFAQSVAEFRMCDSPLNPERLLAASGMGGSEQTPTFGEALAAYLKQERADIVIEWADAWTLLGGVTQLREVPDNFLYLVVESQVTELDEHGVSLDRIRCAAILAGYHQSTELHHGLRAAELEHTGVRSHWQMAVDLWARTFRSTGSRWPNPEERAAFMGQVDRIAADGGFYLDDLLAAAVAAGGYQDPDVTTCLPRHLSVFEAAAVPLQPVV